jgi:hypothetical protein
LLPFFLPSPKQLFKTWPGFLAWLLIPNLVNANAKDRKRIERKRSQKLGEKKGAYAPLIFELALS